MKVTVYELLGMVKDGKAPKKIRYIDKIFTYDELHADYVFMETYGESNTREYLTDWIGLSKDGLTDEVEILEEEKKRPEKLKIEQDTPTSNYYIRNEYGTKCGLTKHSKMIVETLNQLIDYLKSKGDE